MIRRTETGRLIRRGASGETDAPVEETLFPKPQRGTVMRHTSKRRITIVASALSVMLVATVAFAAWTSSGEGTGQAMSTSSIDSTISPDDPGEALFPGATSSFTVEVDNPNDYPVVVTGISAGSSDAVNGCAAGTVTSDAVTDPAGIIAAGDSGTYTLVSHMAGGATDDCQGQTFSLDLTATLESDAS